MPIPVAERSKTRFCCRSAAGIAGSYPGGGMDVCLLCVVSKDLKAKRRTMRTRNQVRMKNRQSTEEYKTKSR
jgi:hypothetical protein